ncbi:PREDICTED: uncharacterized protein LOC108492735 isoform X2 [Lepidothrix coronata]|uniref:Uncharacterized protein LOC108492735 isoform X2 n=1 Tax=Lepidothrix coronata TaxID=321398 RepID=A0A6J0GG78_9PASS|nr:PREDICTED: uncharacterized protein LOC108492735 isoform X2 [Lepidothrix coronata]
MRWVRGTHGCNWPLCCVSSQTGSSRNLEQLKPPVPPAVLWEERNEAEQIQVVSQARGTCTICLYNRFVQSQSAQCKSPPVCSKRKQHSNARTSAYNTRAWQTTFQLCLQHPNAFDPHSKYMNTILVMENIKDQRGKVVMGEVGAWLPWAGEALQLQYTCLYRESTASCHHSSPGERGQHCTWQEAPPQPRVLLEPPHMQSRTPNPSEHQALPQAELHPRGGHWQEVGEIWHAHSPQVAPLACD